MRASRPTLTRHPNPHPTPHPNPTLPLTRAGFKADAGDSLRSELRATNSGHLRIAGLGKMIHKGAIEGSAFSVGQAMLP
jgi:hypothetical protein